jgi:hypothetical protein
MLPNDMLCGAADFEDGRGVNMSLCSKTFRWPEGPGGKVHEHTTLAKQRRSWSSPEGEIEAAARETLPSGITVKINVAEPRTDASSERRRS